MDKLGDPPTLPSPASGGGDGVESVVGRTPAGTPELLGWTNSVTPHPTLPRRRGRRWSGERGRQDSGGDAGATGMDKLGDPPPYPPPQAGEEMEWRAWSAGLRRGR